MVSARSSIWTPTGSKSPGFNEIQFSGQTPSIFLWFRLCCFPLYNHIICPLPYRGCHRALLMMFLLNFSSTSSGGREARPKYGTVAADRIAVPGGTGAGPR